MNMRFRVRDLDNGHVLVMIIFKDKCMVSIC